MIQLKRFLKRVGQNLWRGFLGVLIALGVATMVLGPLTNTMNAYAEPETGVMGSEDDGSDVDDGADDADDAGTSSETAVTTTANKPAMAPTTTSVNSGCKDSLGALGWLICPLTEKISEAVDWLYDKIEVILLINPVEMTDGEPIYELWKYFRAVTNVVFIIFLLVVVWSQLTGVGISNYGVKKALPKLIIAAVMVNLSFIVCSIAVDASNIIGNGLRSVFEGIETTAMGGEAAATGGATASLTDIYAALAGGTAVAIGAAVIAIETGAIWMLIPVALGAIVAVASGLVTIALRQAVVALLIMISPLAIVAYILPNTEQWFKKWRQLLTKMLVFYPMFSLLFGAANLAGWAIIASAKSGFTLMLGAAVQIFPLFFSWKLMQMSGTFLNTINGWMRGVAARPLSANRAWAESHREATRQKYLASENAYTPSLRLMQFLNNRRIARGLETKENEELVATRGAAYAASRHYDANGVPTREGERDYDRQARIMEYQRVVLQDKNNFNKGLGVLEATKNRASAAQLARLGALDTRNVNASDFLKYEQARTEKIDYDNAVSFYNRTEAAMNAHMDNVNRWELDSDGKIKLDKEGKPITRKDYKLHFADNTKEQREAIERYSMAQSIMEGNAKDVAAYIAANAAHMRDTQQKIHDNKITKMAELLPPTKDVEYRLAELTHSEDALENVDAIISFLRVLNQRGDTDLVTKGIIDLMSHDLELGTHASQALAGFTMFEVGGADPSLKRLGKMINLETAQIFNKNKRKNRIFTLKEYVTGQYEEDDPSAPNGKVIRYSKRPMAILLEGTPFDGIERTAMDNMDDIIMRAYTDENGHLDMEGYFRKRTEVEKAIAPQFISASIKQESGSEALKSEVKFKTGYSSEMAKDENGNVLVDQNGDPLYDSKAIWEKDENENPFFENPDYAKGHYREQTLKYLLDQTPIQILQLRSDYYDGLREHLADAFMLEKDDNLNAEQKQIKTEYENELARLRATYGDRPVGEKKRLYEKDLKAARHKIAGAEIRKILDERGTLEQIYRSRHSGAANGAKWWVRDWLGLDNEVAIKDYERERRKKNRAELEEARKRRAEAGIDDSDEGRPYQSPRVYDESFRDNMSAYLDQLIKAIGYDGDEFYAQSLERLKHDLSKDSYIVVEYQKQHEMDPDADVYTMRGWLLDLMDDLDNY